MRVMATVLAIDRMLVALLAPKPRPGVQNNTRRAATSVRPARSDAQAWLRYSLAGTCPLLLHCHFFASWVFFCC